MIAALECREPEDYVPIWEIEFQAWDNLSGKHVILGREFERLSQKEKEIAISTNAEIMIETCKQLHFAALTVVGSYWEVAPGEPSYYWLPDEWRKKQNALLRKYCESEGIATVMACGGLIGMPSHGDGYLEFCYRLMDEPETIDTWAKNTCEYGVARAKEIRDMGYEIVVCPADIADNRGCFYSPAQMERWFYPYLYKWTNEVKSMGMYSILHTDGDVTAALEHMAASSLNALQAIDPVAGMDIAKVKSQVSGRLCLCGNVETGLLVTGPREAIYEDTRRILTECKGDGGLILGTSNASMPETPCENYRQIIDAWEMFGKY